MHPWDPEMKARLVRCHVRDRTILGDVIGGFGQAESSCNIKAERPCCNE
jgi:hypothetical protein